MSILNVELEFEYELKYYLLKSNDTIFCCELSSPRVIT